jgi:hypothetical protein
MFTLITVVINNRPRRSIKTLKNTTFSFRYVFITVFWQSFFILLLFFLLIIILILILSSKLRLWPRSDPLPRDFLTTISYLSQYPSHATCSVHLILFDLNAQIVLLDENYNEASHYVIFSILLLIALLMSITYLKLTSEYIFQIFEN